MKTVSSSISGSILSSFSSIVRVCFPCTGESASENILKLEFNYPSADNIISKAFAVCDELIRILVPH